MKRTSFVVSIVVFATAVMIAGQEPREPLTWTAQQDHQNMMDQLGIKALRPGPNGRAAAGLNKAIPALPVRDVGAAAAHYCDRFGFEAPYVADDFAILVRDDAVLHLRGATDEVYARILSPAASA